MTGYVICEALTLANDIGNARRLNYCDRHMIHSTRRQYIFSTTCGCKGGTDLRVRFRLWFAAIGCSNLIYLV